MNWLFWIVGLLALGILFSPFMLSGQFSREEEAKIAREAAKKLPYLEDSKTFKA